MKRVALLAALLMVGFAVQAEPVSAQDASYARWDGTMTPPGGETVDISYLLPRQPLPLYFLRAKHGPSFDRFRGLARKLR